MNPWRIITELFEPAAKLIDDVHTSTEEKLEIKAKMADMQNKLVVQLMEYESKLQAAQRDVIVAEAQGRSWAQRNWRPITMLTFLALVCLDTMGWTTFRLSEEAWRLLEIGLGGYVVGRSVEKVVPHIAKRKEQHHHHNQGQG